VEEETATDKAMLRVPVVQAWRIAGVSSAAQIRKVKKPFWQVRDLIQKRLPKNGFLFEFKGLSKLTATFGWRLQHDSRDRSCCRSGKRMSLWD
jgi:hypothetical protein